VEETMIAHALLATLFFGFIGAALFGHVLLAQALLAPGRK
jgi:hypothetical protein